MDFPLTGFDAVHASPPCQGYSVTKSFNPAADSYDKLIAPVRERLEASGVPWVIENVEGAKPHMRSPVTLCGSQFGLTAIWEPWGKVGLRRHRLFESNILIPDPGPHDHSLYAVPVFGHGPSGRKAKIYGLGHSQAERDVMGIDWMTREEINESIPPAYSEYIGEFLIQAVNAVPLAA